MGSQLRSLDELAHGLDGHMPPPRWRETKTRRANPVGLGRNCALFESARHWAYREIRNHWGNPVGLERAIHAEANTRNLEFAEPLPASEVRAIAASIHRWIINHFRMWHDGLAVYEATFIAMQSARGKKSATARQNNLTTKLEKGVGQVRKSQFSFNKVIWYAVSLLLVVCSIAWIITRGTITFTFTRAAILLFVGVLVFLGTLTDKD